MKTDVFDPGCNRCERLANFCRQTRVDHPGYHGAPVAAFGDPAASLLVVGLAPGMHGANATGRPFTGDYAGLLLYQTLFDFGFSNQNESVSLNDGLQLHNCRITNAVKCLPPQNKPTGSEISNCNAFLAAELQQLPDKAVLLALGTIAHNAILSAKRLKKSGYRFGHHQVHDLPDGQILVDSYHCSRYNIQTKRLNGEMFGQVFETIQKLLA